MNECYAAEPDAIERASDLKALIGHFGPFAGRYLISLPPNWIDKIQSRFDQAGERESAQVRRLLYLARDSAALIPFSGLRWNANLAWSENVDQHLSGSVPVLTQAFGKEGKPPTITALHDLDLPPTAEERVLGHAKEYARVCEILAKLGPEVHLIDPYLNPAKRNYQLVITEILRLVSQGKTRNIYLWARSSQVLPDCETHRDREDFENAVCRVIDKAHLKPGDKLNFNLVRDEDCESKMHGRYLLTLKGGVRLDQGFQQLPEGRYVDVGPIGKQIHSDLLDIYQDGKHDMKIIASCEFKVSATSKLLPPIWRFMSNVA